MSRFPFIALVSLTFTCTAVAQENPGETAPASAVPGAAQLTLDDLRTFTEVFSQIRRNYVEEVDDRTLLNAAINGMLSHLDPHSNYLPVNDYKQLNDSASGRYSGIGVDVGVQRQRIVVRSVIVPSPADSGGINPGDIITAVDGNPVKGRMLQDAIDELQGEPGSAVAVTILPPEGKEREVKMIREESRLGHLLRQ